jgi:hypothetical protein
MSAYRYFDPMKNWRRIKPHLAEVEPVLVRDFNKYTFGRWREEFTAGHKPFEFESCDWWMSHWTSRRGRMPAYWQYVKHGACHWLCNFNLELAQLTLRQRDLAHHYVRKTLDRLQRRRPAIRSSFLCPGYFGCQGLSDGANTWYDSRAWPTRRAGICGALFERKMKPFRSIDGMIQAHTVMWGEAGRHVALA